MKSILIFDADNTLWDTNAIFHDAQLALLGVLAQHGVLSDPEAQFKTLRTIDQELVHQLGRAEYDFKVLALALIYYFSQKMTVTEVAHTAIHTSSVSQELSKIIDKAHQAFIEELKRTPKLYPDTIPVLTAIRRSTSDQFLLFQAILSEGNPERLERIIEAYGMRKRGLFDEIIITPKNKDAFEKVKQLGLAHFHDVDKGSHIPMVLIGDSLRNDIKFANQAGFITVYKPSLFKGLEAPDMPDETPNYTIKSLSELPEILKKDVGLPIMFSDHQS